MNTAILQTYEALPADVQHAVDRIIEELGKQHVPTGRDPNRPFAGLPGLGSMKGQIWMSDDFDEPLEDFKDHM
ncbi:MAG: DUF2281 domain-containing protein [Hymenobacteraceae bacterium]|nr:DUF2281 domain-containing protein [Hymenobacteraceae bacterium]